jgi:MraZ protein
VFRGNRPTRMDEKGRLKVPAEFKREIDERYSSPKFYLTSKTGKTALLYPMEEWEKFEQEVLKFPENHPLRQKFLLVTSYWGAEAEMDAQGRLLLPQLLREKAELSGDVAVLGKATHMEVHNMSALSQQVEANPFTDEDSAALSSGR